MARISDGSVMPILNWMILIHKWGGCSQGINGRGRKINQRRKSGESSTSADHHWSHRGSPDNKSTRRQQKLQLMLLTPASGDIQLTQTPDGGCRCHAHFTFEPILQMSQLQPSETKQPVHWLIFSSLVFLTLEVYSHKMLWHFSYICCICLVNKCQPQKALE